jgi:hypothetical protein
MNVHLSTISLRSHLLAYGALALLMVATRMEHFGGAVHLPDASLAVFALAGWVGASSMVFVAFLALAVGIDVWAVTLGGVAADCFTPAYPALALAYGALFAFGGWASLRTLTWRVAAGMIATLALAFVASNGSFYQFSGLYSDMALRDYVLATWRYAPAYIGFGFFYVMVGVGAAILAQRLRTVPGDNRSGA